MEQWRRSTPPTAQPRRASSIPTCINPQCLGRASCHVQVFPPSTVAKMELIQERWSPPPTQPRSRFTHDMLITEGRGAARRRRQVIPPSTIAYYDHCTDTRTLDSLSLASHLDNRTRRIGFVEALNEKQPVGTRTSTRPVCDGIDAEVAFPLQDKSPNLRGNQHHGAPRQGLDRSTESLGYPRLIYNDRCVSVESMSHNPPYAEMTLHAAIPLGCGARSPTCGVHKSDA